MSYPRSMYWQRQLEKFSIDLRTYLRKKIFISLVDRKELSRGRTGASFDDVVILLLSNQLVCFFVHKKIIMYKVLLGEKNFLVARR